MKIIIKNDKETLKETHKMKRVLMLASVASMIGQFNLSNIEILQKRGYEVHVACNFEKGSAWTEEKIEELKKKLREMGIRFFQIDFERNVMKLDSELKAYKQVLKLARKYRYAFIHCHSPIGGVVGRLVGHKTNTKVIYTAHGFHFFKGAPILNWLIYYPIEKFLSRFTDVLITINKEDFQRAKKKFHASKVEYVPGVGVDVEKFKNSKVDILEKRKTLGINKKDIVLLSVGELNKNKNHEVVIKALAKMKREDIHYFIAGKGELEEYLKNLVKKLGLETKVDFLGFRKDVIELYKISDIFIFPSKREGLPMALMEAMASGTPCIVSNIRGNIDLIDDGVSGIVVKENNSEEYAKRINQLILNEQLQNQFKKAMKTKINNFSIVSVERKMKGIY